MDFIVIDLLNQIAKLANDYKKELDFSKIYCSDMISIYTCEGCKDCTIKCPHGYCPYNRNHGNCCVLLQGRFFKREDCYSHAIVCKHGKCIINGSCCVKINNFIKTEDYHDQLMILFDSIQNPDKLILSEVIYGCFISQINDTILKDIESTSPETLEFFKNAKLLKCIDYNIISNDYKKISYIENTSNSCKELVQSVEQKEELLLSFNGLKKIINHAHEMATVKIQHYKYDSNGQPKTNTYDTLLDIEKVYKSTVKLHQDNRNKYLLALSKIQGYISQDCESDSESTTSKPGCESNSKPGCESDSESGSESTSESTSESDSESGSKPDSESTSKPDSESDSKPDSESTTSKPDSESSEKTSGKGLLTYKINGSRKIIVSNDVNNELYSLMKKLDTFSISYYETYKKQMEESDIIVIKSIDNNELIPAIMSLNML